MNFTATKSNNDYFNSNQKKPSFNDMAGGGPQMGRNMGFPNMKYLDPDQHGPPVKEETFYK